MRISDCEVDRIGMYAGLLFEPVFFASVAISLLFNPWFDFGKHPLSDLGAIGVNYPWIFNLGLILSGALGMVFSLRILIHLNDPLGMFGYGAFITAFLLILVGVFPDNAEFYIIPHALTMHKFISLLGAAITSLCIIIYSLYWILSRRWRLMGISLLIFGLISGLVGYYLGKPNIAYLEIAFSVTIMVWAYMTIYYACIESGSDEESAGNSS